MGFTDECRDVLDRIAKVSGPQCPAPSQLVLLDRFALGRPGGLRCDPGPSRGGDALGRHLGFDHEPALAEGAPDGKGNARYLGDPVPIGFVEQGPDVSGQRVAERSLEDRVGGVPLPVEGAAVEGGPLPVLALCGVDDEQVDMEAGIGEPARTMQERRPDKAGAVIDEHAGVAPADRAGVLLHEALGVLDCRPQGLLDV